MAAVDKGTAHLYGIDETVTNATVLSFSRNLSFDNVDTTEDESGITIEERMDNRVTDVTITIRPTSSYTEPANGDQITYDSVIYYIMSIDNVQENQGFQAYTLTCRTREGISLV